MYLVNEKSEAIIDLVLGTFTIMSSDCMPPRSRMYRIGSRETHLLRFLTQKNGHMVTKDEILLSVWGGRVVCENTASVAISNIRKIFRRVDSDCLCLVTFSRVGYSFYPERSGFVVYNDLPEYSKGRIFC